MIDKALQTTTGRIYSMRASRGSLELSETNRICNSFGTLTVCSARPVDVNLLLASA
jgi:hypothetical protein